MRVNILVIVAQGKLPVLAVEAVPAEIVLPGRTAAVPAPVPQGADDFMQQRIIRIDSTALAHRHMVGRIET